MLLQAYDFLHLFEAPAYRCTLQVGGSDQWGNITAGIELISRRHRAEAYGLTFPLVTRSDGAKFGKSEGGNLWLDPARTSPFQFFQFWLQVPDADAGRYLRLFTWLPLERIEELEGAVAIPAGAARGPAGPGHRGHDARPRGMRPRRRRGGRRRPSSAATWPGSTSAPCSRSSPRPRPRRSRGRSSTGAPDAGGPAGPHRAGEVPVGGPHRDRPRGRVREQPAGERPRAPSGGVGSAGRVVPPAPKGKAQLPPGALHLTKRFRVAKASPGWYVEKLRRRDRRGRNAPEVPELYIWRRGSVGHRPQPSRTKDRSAPPSMRRVLSWPAHLENGTETAKKRQCGRSFVIAKLNALNGQRVFSKTHNRSVPVGARGSVTSQHRLSDFWSTSRLARDLDGEFDPGSGRTLAACLTHASRAKSNRWQHRGRLSGERVSNT